MSEFISLFVGIWAVLMVVTAAVVIYTLLVDYLVNGKERRD